MKLRLLCITVFYCLALCCVYSLEEWQGLVGLPFHHLEISDLNGLRGERLLMRGEAVNWVYPFSWFGATKEGTRVNLDKNIYILGGKKDNEFYVFRKQFGVIKIKLPPNASDRKLFSLATVKVVGAPKSVVMNRIGSPTRTRQDDTGEHFFYSKESTRTRKEVDSILTTTTGTVGWEPFYATSYTYVPRIETLTYNPYAFVLHIGTNGIVKSVEDLCTKAAKWKNANAE